MIRRRYLPTAALSVFLAALFATAAPGHAAETFEFAEKPSVTVEGDDVTITFSVKEYCDATVAIEDAQGANLRHLASGVLGENAPEPFQKNSLRQTVVWDGKDDRGRYVDDKGSVVVRVSLGLKARLERELFWSPKKRTRSVKYLSSGQALLAVGREGLYVCDGLNGDHIRLFDFDGNYVRTIYPFPHNKMMGDEVEGLDWRTFPQDGKRLPTKRTADYHT
ncbi:MAG: hypothetical protein R6V58_15260, partial [Planctomycetota bacterium]